MLTDSTRSVSWWWQRVAKADSVYFLSLSHPEIKEMEKNGMKQHGHGARSECDGGGREARTEKKIINVNSEEQEPNHETKHTKNTPATEHTDANGRPFFVEAMNS